jgi:hypothetical protein
MHFLTLSASLKYQKNLKFVFIHSFYFSQTTSQPQNMQKIPTFFDQKFPLKIVYKYEYISKIYFFHIFSLSYG